MGNQIWVQIPALSPASYETGHRLPPSMSVSLRVRWRRLCPFCRVIMSTKQYLHECEACGGWLSFTPSLSKDEENLVYFKSEMSDIFQIMEKSFNDEEIKTVNMQSRP